MKMLGVIVAMVGAIASQTPKSSKPVTLPPRVEFLRDIAPILDRNRCSAAECHGKFGGRGGFQVSLLTLSPEDDYEPIVLGERGRRVNLAEPKRSLFLLKSTGQVPHAGGQRFKVDSPDYKTIERWIDAGCPLKDDDVKLKNFAVTPGSSTIARVGATLSLKVEATFSDGSRRDVTQQAVYQSSNDAVFSVDERGKVTGKRWGGGSIVVRYLGTVQAAFVTLPQQRVGAWKAPESAHPVDKLVNDNLRHLNVLPSELCADEEFLRRVMLDLTGRLPSPTEQTTFLANTTSDKRSKLIDKLLESPEYVDLRTMRLCDLLRVNPRKLGNGNGNLSDRAATLMYDWIRKSVETNEPWDKFVNRLITARGSCYIEAPTNFYRVERSPNDRMENIGQAFLGVRMSCARCHKHPFDRWTTDDYWNFAAFMGKVSTKSGKLYDEAIIGYDPGTRIRNKSVNGRNRGKVALATYLGEAIAASESGDQITELASWMTSSKNPFFARATMNRLWSWYFGRGVVHPVDDMRATSPESVPGLLDLLSKEFVNSGFDSKHMVRWIMNSRTYQASSLSNETNKLDDRFFSHFFARPMTAQVLLDTINQCSGTNETFGAFPERSRAVQAALPPSNTFLNAFGVAHRDTLADIDPKPEPNLIQTLMMINAPYIEGKLKSGGVAAQAAKESKTIDELADRLYRLVLCRKPTEAERKGLSASVGSQPISVEVAQDILWALVTSREFYFIH